MSLAVRNRYFPEKPELQVFARDGLCTRRSLPPWVWEKLWCPVPVDRTKWEATETLDAALDRHLGRRLAGDAKTVLACLAPASVRANLLFMKGRQDD